MAFLTLFVIFHGMVAAKPVKPCIPTNICTTEHFPRVSSFKSEQYVCSQNGTISRHMYEVADCEGIPTKIVAINDSKIDPNFDLISCSAECSGYFHYKSTRLPMTESDCSNLEKYGFKEYLVSWNCLPIQERYSQELSCTDNSVTMKYYGDNALCDGEPMLNTKVENGCQEVDFMFFERRAHYMSYQEIMAHDLFNYDDAWDQNIASDEVINLEDIAEKQRRELLAEQWCEGELFVTLEHVTVYENPTYPSPIVCELWQDTVILLSSLKNSMDYGGFRDVLLPIRGWIWTQIDDYDRAFHDASRMVSQPIRERTGSMMKMKKKMSKIGKKLKGKKQLPHTQTIQKPHHSSDDIMGGRNHLSLQNDPSESVNLTRSEADIVNMPMDISAIGKLTNIHQREKTNHLYIDEKQRQTIKKQKQKQQNIIPSQSKKAYTPDPVEPPIRDIPIGVTHHSSKTPEPQNNSHLDVSVSYNSYDNTHTHTQHSSNSKFRRMSHQVRYEPAAIKKIERPISLKILNRLKADDERVEANFNRLELDSDGTIIGQKKVETLRSRTDTQIITNSKQQQNERPKSNNDETEKESMGSKILNSTCIRRIILFVRSKPAILTLIYIIFTGFVEGIIFFDFITDSLVALSLARGAYQIFFVTSWVLIITPYFIAWSSLWGLIEKKRESVGKDKNSKHIIFRSIERYKWFVRIFSFAPLGVILLILFDFWILFEFIIIRPIYFLFRFKLFRTDTFEELGYRKLRRVSEVCSETIFQAVVQLLILVTFSRTESREQGVNLFDVVLSLLASFFVIILWFGIILRIEASSNGISIIEYLPIVLQGSFKFVPFLPAIEKGTKNGKAVNWCSFKFDLSALSALGKALGSRDCDLQIIKVSLKTFKKLPRFGCKFFARLINTAYDDKEIKVVISRLDTDLEHLFELFDVENTKAFNFANFCRATLALRAQDNELLKYKEISSIFYDLAAGKSKISQMDENEVSKLSKEEISKNEQKVWLLDLMLKLQTSKKYISVLDIEQPEDYCVKKKDVNLLTFVRAMGISSDNHEQNVISAVCQNKLDIAHVLTEDEGIPIVIEITEGRELLSSYMKFHGSKYPQILQSMQEVEVLNNDVCTTQYFKLNRLLNGDEDNEDNLLEDFDKEVSIYCSVAMCEIQKETDSTKESINQFWNEKLLFVIPYSVIDEIQNDVTRTLERDTMHSDHHPNTSSFYTLHTAHEKMDTQTFNLPMTDDEHSTNMEEQKFEDLLTNSLRNNRGKNITDAANAIPLKAPQKHVRFSSDDHNEVAIEMDIKSKTQKHKNSNSSSLPTGAHHLSINTYLSNSGHLSDHLGLQTKKSASFRPLTHRRTHRRAETALRDNQFVNSMLGRQNSIGISREMPHFEKKIYLDFNLFDDSTIQQTNNERQMSMDNIFDFNQSCPTHRSRAMSKPIKFRPSRRGTTPGAFYKATSMQSHDSDGDLGSDDEEKIDLDTPRSPQLVLDDNVYSNVNANMNMNGNNVNNGNMDDGDGTFLGSCHISINIEDADRLEKFHESIQEKEIKIGRKDGKRRRRSSKIKDENEDDFGGYSKLKFKVYCNALAAYLKYGKNYGDKIRKQELIDLQLIEKMKTEHQF